MVATTLNGVLLTGDHASRPTATTVAKGTLYSCTTHSLVYQSDASSWSTWATLGTGASAGSPSLTFSTSAATGAASTFVATDATLPIFDATAPTTQAFSDSAAVGTAAFAARRDHKHGMPAASAGNWTRLADSVLGSDTANFDLTSISGSYKHLVLELALRSDRASSTNDNVKLLVNNDTGSNYDYVFGAFGSGSSFPGYLNESYGATSAQVSQVPAASSNAGAIGVVTIRLSDYASTTLHKEWSLTGFSILDNSSGNGRIVHGGGRWKSTSAITRLTISPVTGSNWKTGSRATLYGLD